MKITHKKKISKDLTPRFTVTIEWMHGDADGYSKTSQDYGTEAEMLSAVTALTEFKNLENTYWNAFCDLSGGSDKIADKIPAIKEFFEKYIKTPKDEQQYCGLYDNFFDEIGFEAASDMTYTDASARVDSFKITQIESNTEFEIIVE